MKQSKEDTFPNTIDPQLWIYVEQSLKSSHLHIHRALNKIKHDKGLSEAKADLVIAVQQIVIALSKL